MKYNRILLKLSGEALMGEQQFGIDPDRLNEYAEQIVEIAQKGVQIGIVIGGGNIFRGIQGASQGFDRIQGDYMGMLATVINSMAMQQALIGKGTKAVLLSGLFIDRIADTMSSAKAIRFLEEGQIVVMAAGTGNPFFTTDTGSALRAVEIKADIILKGTRVDGIYTADPEKDPTAMNIAHLTHDKENNRHLKVMDINAIGICKVNDMPMYVFDMNTKGNLMRVLNGENIGTLVKK